jgi:hypothetical protein
MSLRETLGIPPLAWGMDTIPGAEPGFQHLRPVAAEALKLVTALCGAAFAVI